MTFNLLLRPSQQFINAKRITEGCGELGDGFGSGGSLYRRPQGGAILDPAQKSLQLIKGYDSESGVD